MIYTMNSTPPQTLLSASTSSSSFDRIKCDNAKTSKNDDNTIISQQQQQQQTADLVTMQPHELLHQPLPLLDHDFANDAMMDDNIFSFSSDEFSLLSSDTDASDMTMPTNNTQQNSRTVAKNNTTKGRNTAVGKKKRVRPTSTSNMDNDMSAYDLYQNKPLTNDVVCGRDRFSHAHAGNKQFRTLIEENRKRYQTASSRDEKTRITHQLVTYIRNLPSGGRFLKLDTQNQRWYDVGDEYAREKVSHALRSAKDPALRKPRKKKQQKPPKARVVVVKKKQIRKPKAGPAFQALRAKQMQIFADLLEMDSQSRKRGSASPLKQQIKLL